MLKGIRKFFGEILTVIGFGIFSYNILNFSVSGTSGIGVMYRYQDDKILCITIGVMLIVSGILIIKNKNN